MSAKRSCPFSPGIHPSSKLPQELYLYLKPIRSETQNQVKLSPLNLTPLNLSPLHMSQRINFGIDLGTTNSAIALVRDGQSELIRNPAGLHQLLPSVVAFRGEKIIVGEKAREWLRKEPSQVFSAFKRKMGTSHQFTLPSGQSITPEELSAQVLKELRQFLPLSEQPAAAVVTIPASFDTVQAQATLRAGELAGFTQVKLLQEPIAASLAYANQAGSQLEGRWLVYDLGGGTFDVALVQIQAGEMTVVDHEGDNFLGGTDIDLAIVTKILVPHLQQQGRFTNLESDLRRDRSPQKGLLQKLLLLAEEAKIELSSRLETEIELSLTDEDGKEQDLILHISREDLVPLLQPMLDRSLSLLREMFDRQQVQPSDLQTILLVGGTTYIPYIREQLAQQLGIPVSTAVDPTTVVAMGAAQYAATQRLELPDLQKETSESGSSGTLPDEALQVRMGYQKVTQEMEEYVVAEVVPSEAAAFFRIIRADGGFDSGLLPFQGKIRQYLPLLPAVQNEFQLRLFDNAQQELPTAAAPIVITQGKYALHGQPLPLDLSLEVDDADRKVTRLEVIFPKNTLLPARKTITRQLSRSISQGSEDTLTIRVLEGDAENLPAANLPIGTIRLDGRQISRSLVRGSDVEISFEITESRSLKVEVYLMMTDQTITEVFTPAQRKVNLDVLRGDLYLLRSKTAIELTEAEIRDQIDLAKNLTDLEYAIHDLIEGAEALEQDDVTDALYQLEDQSRKVAGRLHLLVRDQEFLRVQETYFDQKRMLEKVLEEYEPNQEDQRAARELLAEEKLILSSQSALRILLYGDRLRQLSLEISWRSNRYVRQIYHGLRMRPIEKFLQPSQAKALFQQGDLAIQLGDDQQLRATVNQLFGILPKSSPEAKGFLGTGLG